jgi:Inner membrane component domain
MRSRRVATPFVEAELTKGEYHNEARSQPGMSAISVLLNLLWILFGGLWMAAGWLIAAIVMAADHRTWAEDGSESRDLCNHPKVELDAWCQRLRGCVQCNQMDELLRRMAAFARTGHCSVARTHFAAATVT